MTTLYGIVGVLICGIAGYQLATWAYKLFTWIQFKRGPYKSFTLFREIPKDIHNVFDPYGHSTVISLMCLKDGIHVNYQNGMDIRFDPIDKNAWRLSREKPDA